MFVEMIYFKIGPNSIFDHFAFIQEFFNFRHRSVFQFELFPFFGFAASCFFNVSSLISFSTSSSSSKVGGKEVKINFNSGERSDMFFLLVLAIFAANFHAFLVAFLVLCNGSSYTIPSKLSRSSALAANPV